MELTHRHRRPPDQAWPPAWVRDKRGTGDTDLATTATRERGRAVGRRLGTAARHGWTRAGARSPRRLHLVVTAAESMATSGAASEGGRGPANTRQLNLDCCHLHIRRLASCNPCVLASPSRPCHPDTPAIISSCRDVTLAPLNLPLSSSPSCLDHSTITCRCSCLLNLVVVHSTLPSQATSLFSPHTCHTTISPAVVCGSQPHYRYPGCTIILSNLASPSHPHHSDLTRHGAIVRLGLTFTGNVIIPTTPRPSST